MPAVRPFALNLDPEMHLRVRELAEAQHRPAQSLLQEAVTQYVEREEAQEALFRQECLDSWAEFEATGLHVTHAEVDAWLAELEAGRAAEPPECHT